MNKFKESDRILVAIANGVKTAGEYAIYKRKIRNPHLRDIATMQGCFNEQRK